jgi:hypothetical protein
MVLQAYQRPRKRCVDLATDDRGGETGKATKAVKCGFEVKF